MQRMVGLGTELSRRIKCIVDDLSSMPFSKQQYNNQLTMLYSLFSTDDLVASAECRWDM